MRLYDVTVVLRPGMPVWPGEPCVEIERIQSIEAGAAANVSAIRAGVHVGTHVDAPLHFVAGGKSVESLPLDLFVGRARVVAMEVERRIDAADLEALRIERGERLLFKTSNSGLWEREGFRPDFVHLTRDAARHLVESGVRTVGVDYLSVEEYGLVDAPVHHILLDAGGPIIERLDLREVGPAEYELIPLPPKLAGSDGAPARVVLRDIG
jgi:arylformamidase